MMRRITPQRARWLLSACAALGACSEVVASSQGAPQDASSADASLDAASADAPSVGDTAPDQAQPPAMVAFAMQNGIAPTDGPALTITFLDDGSVFWGYPFGTSGDFGRSLGRLPDGPVAVARLRAEVESAGLLGVSDGDYPARPPGGWFSGTSLLYQRDGRRRSWHASSLEAAPAPLAQAIRQVCREIDTLSLSLRCDLD